MRSAASFRGHPIHPMLIPFPFAFLTGAFVFDLAGHHYGNMDLSYTGRNLTFAGIGMGLLAAIPGVIDYVRSVPPRSSGKKRARLHALFNVTALLLFTASAFVWDDGEASHSTLGLQGLGLLFLMRAGWMGGTLVFRNQIGVDHRYAGAGKWHEISVPRTGDRVVVADATELEPDQMKLVKAGDARIVVARTEDGCKAFDDYCTHRGGPLSDGVLICGTVQCPWHGSQFDIETGEVKAGPATARIKTHYVEESNGQIRLGV